ncbi:hypothetical protein FRC14_004656 [Serendipita sp. 396]|nr:hypothetical protein FRC14_004656 [Serendipita sp. 396]KAG8787515.1 hypothetical protein FRC15_009000 [Serendipita sp. 397]KAG8802978.1 hypothetical protein FRC16_008105 [Serendipita sp. 398]KAG8808689.1 hypothetical protein FRC19_005719 [Serendipita sp. 401]KAG8838031.1 hypothetical protein FRC18_006616 [Serendipita sp. 400]KAG8873448.1 hypothetical protein FRC20_007991 [Serendipita sp. 405]
MLARGDLGGDIYLLILDPKLYNKPPEENIASPWLDLLRPSDVKDLDNFVTDYIKHSVASELRTADQAEKCMEDPDCLKLASLHSTAVDFPKTGTPVYLSDLPRVPLGTRPDWDSGEINVKTGGVVH